MRYLQQFSLMLSLLCAMYIPSLGYAQATTQAPASVTKVAVQPTAKPAAQTTAPAAQSAALPTPVGRVVWVKGTLTATMPNNEKRTLQKTSIIYLKDTLTTDATSQAQIVFTDNTLMTFRPGTKFVIDQYAYKPSTQKGSVGKYVMKLLEGGFRTITGLIAKSNPSDYQVNTPVATIGVRGTDYAVFFKGTEVYLGYYEGQPCMTSAKASGTVCLSQTTPYAKVAAADVAPVPLMQRPAVFDTKLEIVPTKITPFAAPTGTVSPSSTAPRGSGGPITSFCISN